MQMPFGQQHQHFMLFLADQRRICEAFMLCQMRWLTSKLFCHPFLRKNQQPRAFHTHDAVRKQAVLNADVTDE